MNDPLVSVCIPMFNAEKHIESAIISVLAQSYKNIELIIVDDGSTDKSLTIAKKFENGRIKVITQPNQGSSSARNSCLLNISGEYIQFLDADDLLSPDKIAEQVNALVANPGMVAVCSTVHFPDGKDHLNYSPSLYEESFLIDADPVRFLLNLYGGFGEGGSMVQPNAWMTPRTVIEKAGPWDLKLSLDDDGEYFCRVILASSGVMKTKGYNYYRKHSQNNNNVSALKEREHLESQYRSISLKISYLSARNSSDHLNKIHARWLHDLKFMAYPEHMDLVKKINGELKRLQFTFQHRYSFATRAGKICNNLMGWKIAKRLQILKQKLH